ncbi:hypothetical protein [Zavarzinella formosa]|uniref:hypothetical protein n=1 Tax=Zavarzinella formosa TaxID=360055 RepID=UPI0003077E40|nr:hypothetical protein [Zavarzinella formosa]
MTTLPQNRLMHDSAYSGMVAACEVLRGVDDPEVFARRLYEVFMATLEIYQHYLAHEKLRTYQTVGAPERN